MSEVFEIGSRNLSTNMSLALFYISRLIRQLVIHPLRKSRNNLNLKLESLPCCHNIIEPTSLSCLWWNVDFCKTYNMNIFVGNVKSAKLLFISHGKHLISFSI